MPRLRWQHTGSRAGTQPPVAHPPKGPTRPVPDTEWMLQASCRGLYSPDEEYDLMFPRSEQVGAGLRRAKRLCLSCPVRRECGRYALATRQPAGVWGGLSTQERREHGRGQPIRRCHCGLLFAAASTVPVCSACRQGYQMAAEEILGGELTDSRCGTRPGYEAHKRREEPACERCKVAKSVDNRDRYRVENGVVTEAGGYAEQTAQRLVEARELFDQPLTRRQKADRMGVCLDTLDRYMRRVRAEREAAS